MALCLLLQGQGLGQLDHLAGGEAELARADAGVDVDLDLGQLAGGRGIEGRPVDEAQPGELALIAEEDILADGEVGQQRLLLEHHADALAHGMGSRQEADRLAAQ